MPKHGKNFRKALEGSNLQERFSIEDAVSKSLGASLPNLTKQLTWPCASALTPNIPTRWFAAL